ncbi:hemerythrin superfamily protein [Actinoplanes octamycinicus]|uniref:Hemerythrin superfamily protein n=1 Tax=Actinoplanes octamycinicus TaxID=135948 RepID=A0A7W7GYB4_9ACTN|nr:hemerythrin domain-containing protein [Actinoplanes octamycinicus]MBB4740560.1 hemerythrin superfamily protein [Actinoplanes octamycinicus]GIE59818.1 hemerythrin [Actinoplanes octamycinicus]
MPDIVEIIKEQHQKVDELLEKAASSENDQLAILQEVARMLLPHSEAEEDFVYPAIRAKAAETGDEVRDGVEEHHQIEEMLQNLLNGSPDDPGWDGTLAAITGELRHHVEEEEQDLLPVLADKLSDAEREEMGRRFIEATTGALPQQDHPTTREELYEKAKEQHIPGRSKMTKDELAKAVSEA